MPRTLPHKRVDSTESGFTIVELMIATVVFSSVLLLCSIAIVHVGRMYYRGLITNRTQDTARKVVDDVSRTIQFGKFNEVVSEGDSQISKCVGNVRYTHFSNSKDRPQGSNDSRHVLVRSNVENGEGCGSGAPDLNSDLDGEDISLLGHNMRLVDFEIYNNEGAAYMIKITVSYGDTDDLFEDDNFRLCKGVIAGGQFCAVSTYSTTVRSRI